MAQIARCAGSAALAAPRLCRLPRNYRQMLRHFISYCITNRKTGSRANMKILTFARPLLVITFAIALHGQAQDYPARIIKIIVPYPAGGGTDVVARLVAERLREKWGQPVVIENRGGAGGNIGSEAVFKAAPDGYTLLFAAPGPLAINKSLYARINYEPEAFAPVTIVATST
ncbi:MAG: tripartite tricarboxylate transporter substrate-binding protein, partial [Burkholderiales bacterium]